MSKLVDMTGMRFGRLLVLERGEGRGIVKWVCRCDCGNNTVVSGDNLRRGHTLSCGCYQKERASEANSTHRESHSRLYNIWSSMVQRCCNPRNHAYHYYGGRGIEVCAEWMAYTCFRDWALENGYDKNLTLDRINNDMGYSPNNCRWITMKEQSNNRRARGTA